MFNFYNILFFYLFNEINFILIFNFIYFKKDYFKILIIKKELFNFYKFVK